MSVMLAQSLKIKASKLDASPPLSVHDAVTDTECLFLRDEDDTVLQHEDGDTSSGDGQLIS